MFRCKELKIFDRDKKLVDINFNIDKSLALVGESGSGKSLTLKSILGLTPKNLEVDFKYESSFKLKNGESLSFVPQNPFTSLSPLTKIKNQFLLSDSIAKRNLSLVGLDSSLLDRFPSELSGGQLQRVIIAMSLNPKVELILLDEPTTALDLENKRNILKLLKKLMLDLNFKILFVTHDIDSIETLCEDIIVLYRGDIVESGKTIDILQNPQTKYAKNLIDSNFSKRGFRE